MTIGLLGKKCGMTRIFTEDGASVPVTVIEVLPNRITQIKTVERDGYQAIQVTAGNCKRAKLSKGEAGHFAAAGVEPGAGLWEFRLTADDKAEYAVGNEIKVDLFAEGNFVDVTGTSRGKGFAGTVKRHNFRTKDATHGNSVSHRTPGSIGQRQSPGKVFKGKKMSGQMGNERCTVQSQRIIKIDAERNLLLIRGAVPGAPNGFVVVKPAVKIDA